MHRNHSNQMTHTIIVHFRRYFSGINHVGKYKNHLPTARVPNKTHIRLNFNRAEDKIEQQLGTKLKEPRQLSLLVRPFLFMIGVSLFAICRFL